jgi:hypothetical protein
MSSSTLESPVPAQQGAQPANTVLADLMEAIETYPQTYLTVEIVEVNPEGPETGINEHEDVTFRIRVHNSGPLNVLDLKFLVKSEDGADGVKYHGGTAFNSSMYTIPIDLVPGHMHDGDWVETPDHYHFEAGDVSHGKVDLVSVSVDTWDTDLDHLTKGHSDPVGSVGDTLTKSVLKG